MVLLPFEVLRDDLVGLLAVALLVAPRKMERLREFHKTTKIFGI